MMIALFGYLQYNPFIMAKNTTDFMEQTDE